MPSIVHRSNGRTRSCGRPVRRSEVVIGTNPGHTKLSGEACVQPFGQRGFFMRAGVVEGEKLAIDVGQPDALPPYLDTLHLSRLEVASLGDCYEFGHAAL